MAAVRLSGLWRSHLPHFVMDTNLVLCSLPLAAAGLKTWTRFGSRQQPAPSQLGALERCYMRDAI